MQARWHAAASVSGGALLTWLTGSLPAGCMFALGGFFIDLDHVLEYVFLGHPLRINREFFQYWYDFNAPTVWLWFHAWEWVVLVLGLAALGVAPHWLGGLGLGMLEHLLLDQIGNPLRPRAYWLLYRWRVRFDSRAIFVPEHWKPQSNKP